MLQHPIASRELNSATAISAVVPGLEDNEEKLFLQGDWAATPYP